MYSAELVTVNFRGSVPAELEAIFRRGQEWEEGWELAAGLALQVGGWVGATDGVAVLPLSVADVCRCCPCCWPPATAVADRLLPPLLLVACCTPQAGGGEAEDHGVPGPKP